MTTWLKVVMEGGRAVVGVRELSDEAGEERSVRHRGSGRKRYFIMHQIRKIHNLSLHPAPNATQLSLTPAKNITASEERRGKKEKVKKKKKKLLEPQQQPMGKINMQMYARN